MANKPAFNMAEKALLTKLHIVAMDDIKLPNEYILVNSGFAVNGKIDVKRTDYSKIANQDSDKIKFFENSSNIYEVGIAVTENGIKAAIPGFNLVKAEADPSNLYKEVENKFGATEVNAIKDKAYNYIVEYMTSFCGEKYAKSISKEKVVCMAFPNIDYIQKSKNGIIGDCDTKCKQASILLYKIGYTVGKSK